MKKFIIIVMMIIAIMTMTGCSEKEEAKVSNDPPVVITETIIEEDILVEEIITEDIS